MVDRIAFADFLDRLADNQTSVFEWQRYIVQHYLDEFLEEMRRSVVRLMSNQLPYHGETEPGREALRCWAMAIRASTRPSNADDVVVLAIDPNEAVVIDELLRRFSMSGNLTIEHPAEKQALNNLECVFEKNADRPCWPSLDDARAILLTQEE